MASKRKEILTTLQTQLSTISVSNGYNNDVNNVSLTFKSFEDINEYPEIVILPAASRYAPLTNSEYTSGSAEFSTDGWAVHVFGYVQVQTNVDDENFLTKKIEDMIEDIITLMLSDHTIGLSYVRNVYLSDVLPYADWEENRGVAELIFEVKYDFPKTTP